MWVGGGGWAVQCMCMYMRMCTCAVHVCSACACAGRAWISSVAAPLSALIRMKKEAKRSGVDSTTWHVHRVRARIRVSMCYIVRCGKG